MQKTVICLGLKSQKGEFKGNSDKLATCRWSTKQVGRLPATQLGHGHLLSVLDSLTSVLEPLLCTKLLRRKKKSICCFKNSLCSK